MWSHVRAVAREHLYQAYTFEGVSVRHIALVGVEIIFIFFPTPARIWYGFKKVGASYEADTYSETMSLRTESFLVGLIGDGITSSPDPSHA